MKEYGPLSSFEFMCVNYILGNLVTLISIFHFLVLILLFGHLLYKNKSWVLAWKLLVTSEMFTPIHNITACLKKYT